MSRLGELGGMIAAPAEDPDPEMGGGGGAFMPDFFQQVQQIKGAMANIKDNLVKLEAEQGKVVTDVYGHGANGDNPKDNIEELTDGTNALSTQIRNALKKMDAELKQKAQEEPESVQSSDFRIRKNMHATLTKKFMDVMQDYQDRQTKYKKKYEEMCKRQYKIVKPNATEEEIQDVIENGGEQIFTDHMLSTSSQKAEDALKDVQDKHKDIQKLESSIQELHQLFVDLSVLVESQGEMLDNIENSVSTSLAYTKTGVQELEKANEYAKKSRKKMCILIIIFLVVACVLIGPMLMDAGSGS